MKKLILITSFVVSANVHAQGIGDSLIVNLTNGQRVAVPLANIQKITFDTLTSSGVSSTLPIAGGAGGGLGLTNYPNPLTARTTIDFTLAEAGPVTIDIFDSKGTLIRNVAHASSLAPGQHEIIWDGLGSNAQPVPPGDYYYEIRFKDQVQTRRAVVIR